MNRTLAVVATLLVSMTLAGAASAAGHATPRVDRRQVRQQQRITHGVHQGSLTAREVLRLERGQAHVARMEFRAKRDGFVSGRERARLHRAQDVQSRHIHRARHNRRNV